MKRNARRWLMAGSAAALLTVPAFAQQSTPPADNPQKPMTQPAPEAQPQQPGTNQPPAGQTTQSKPSTEPGQKLTFRTTQQANELASLQGTPVQNPMGETVGTIKDVVVDQSGKVSTVVLGVGGFFGIGSKQVGVPFEALSFSTDSKSGQRVALLSASKDTLKSAPEYKSLQESAGEMKKNASPPGKSS